MQIERQTTIAAPVERVSGFEALEGTDDQRRTSLEDNTEGWEIQLGNVRSYAERVTV